MYPALDIATQFINKSIAAGKPVTPMKLQKLIYLAHGLHLARHDKPLIRERVQAWSYGPVIPEIYGRFKKWGNNPITTPIPTFDDVNETPLDPDAQDTIDFAWDIAKDFNAIQLSNWTHIEGSPWYRSVSRNESGVMEQEVIDNDLIKEYFNEIIRRDVGA
ncbi:Panacea domain-containing protein [Tellurirhabdus rosea]|uniref:Panacea domain-containing protein n=1 Tax=Tellurirhabdus rosea TaxID=2674997 RepID=UPI00224C9F40|nr:type II toxin-antitoxin system antitoxin SocA domain-containing protein [Tellurirhabdus rosea]